MTWFALYTEQQREEFARDRLKANGYSVFYPHIPQCGYRGRMWNKPYYPRYLFVDCVHDWTMSELIGIWMIPGVIGPVRSTCGMPYRIRREALQPLFDVTDHLGAVHVPEAPKPLYGLQKGNRVKLAEGNAFWGMVAEVQSVDNDTIIGTIDGLIGRVMIAPDQVGEVLTGAKNGGAKPSAYAACAAG